MKNFFLAILLCLVPIAAVAGNQQPPNPVDYPLTAHVVASHAGPGLTSQEVEAVIDGRQVVLLGNSAGVLALGDYKARLLKGSYTPTKPNGYDLYITYEFLFPDSHTRPYELIGLGADVLPPTEP